MHCGDQRHLGLCLGYVPALAYGSCRVSDQGTTLRASDLHNARATILNPFNNGRGSVSNHQPHDCLLYRLFRRRSKKTSKLRVTGLCAGNSPGTGEFPAQVASNAEMVPFDDVIMRFLCAVQDGTFISGNNHALPTPHPFISVTYGRFECFLYINNFQHDFSDWWLR